MFEQTPYAQAFLKKTAFVPYTQEAMNPPAPQGGDDPNAVPPQDPNAALSPEQGGMPPQGGAPQEQMPPIQIVQGPNGEPIDAETGFIVLDQQQGIEQDPLTGILFNKPLGEFATPEGQPLDPNQAMQMIMQAQQQAGAAGAPQSDMPQQGGAPMPPPDQGTMPPDQGAMPPQDPAMQMPPQQAPQMQGNQTFDPSTGMMVDDATGLPVNPNTGMLVDPATGQQIDPQTGMPAQGPQGDPNMPFTGDPEVMKAIESLEKNNERTAKSVSSLSHNIGAVRTDIQGLRRQFDTFKDQQDQIMQQINNFLQILEGSLQGR